MKAKNQVISGYGAGANIFNSGSALSFKLGNNLGERVIVKNNRYNSVVSYDVLNEDIVKSGTSAVLKGMLGSALIGNAGLLAGISAKNVGIYTIAIEFKDGKRSLIEIDDVYYKVLMKRLF